jgi:hypothetical protein
MPYDFANSSQVSTVSDNPLDESVLFGMVHPLSTEPSMFSIGGIVAKAVAQALANIPAHLPVPEVPPTIKTSGTTYTTSSNCHQLQVECVGGGGVGGAGIYRPVVMWGAGAAPGYGGGGGAAGYCSKLFTVTPSTTYNCVIGGPSQDTSFTVGAVTATAHAGANGADGRGVQGAPGSGGTATGGDVNITGAPGVLTVGGGNYYFGNYGTGGTGGSAPTTGTVAGLPGSPGAILLTEKT